MPVEVDWQIAFMNAVASVDHDVPLLALCNSGPPSSDVPGEGLTNGHDKYIDDVLASLPFFSVSEWVSCLLFQCTFCDITDLGHG